MTVPPASDRLGRFPLAPYSVPTRSLLGPHLAPVIIANRLVRRLETNYDQVMGARLATGPMGW